MAKSKQVTDWLKERRQELRGEMEQLVTEIEVLDKKIEQAPTRTFRKYGVKYKVSDADPRLIDKSYELHSVLNHVGYKLLEIESLLSPKKGRPEKALDPRQQAAIDERVRGGAHKLSYKQLAIKHSGLRDPIKLERFAGNLKKANKKFNAPQPKNGK